MKKTVLLVVSMLMLAGCKTRPVAPVATYESSTEPPIGTTATAGVGEHLITQLVGMSTAAIVVPEDQKMGDFLIMKGRYPASATHSEYGAFRNVTLQNMTTGARKSAHIYLFNKDKGTKTACISKSICGTLNYTLDRDTSVGLESTQKTLIYSGKIGEKITLGYREFSGGMARSAFSNDVVYDLAASRILGYKGARLEVIQANNTEITYKVLADFK